MSAEHRPRVGFVTCIQLGRSVIEAILDMGGSIDLLVTLPDDKAVTKSGRVFLDDIASRHSITLLKTPHVDLAADAIAAADLDWLLIIGWSQIAGPAVLTAARNGAVGMHPTLLPFGRGNAAVPWAILKGLAVTGVTAFVLDSGVDTGPILDQVSIPVSDRETATTLYSRVDAAHVDLIRRLWPRLLDRTAVGVVQDSREATVWPRRTPADGLFDPAGCTVEEVDRLVRATTRPYPGAFFADVDGSLVTVWAGAPGRADDRDLLVLTCSDGHYTVTDHEPRC